MAIDIPFNYDPVDNIETSSSYTVPAGRYAILSVTLSVTATGSVSGSGIGNTSIVNATSDSSETTIELKLKSGEIVTKTETAASSSVSSSGTSTGWYATAATSIASVLVNGIATGTVKASATSGVFDGDGGSGNNVTASITGTADVTWHIAEYTSIT